MVKIKKVRLRNFKSFRKADMPIADGFSAIVGANASGKSNIVDALMFVFGITSLKMLRAAKLTDLVNHSAPENYAKVEVELQAGLRGGTAGLQAADGGAAAGIGGEMQGAAAGQERTYTISRTIDKQGRGVVRLDGKKRSLGEVTALLAEIGVRPTGYNIVTQGDVTRIVETGPKQRREIIEEIAGLREFEEKKGEALRKLEKVDERVKNVDLVLRERESYLEELEREREAALRYQALSDELRASRAGLLFMRISQQKRELEKIGKGMANAEKEIAEKRKEKEALQKEAQGVEAKLSETNERILASAKDTYATLGRDVEEKKSAVRVSEQRIAGFRDALAGTRERMAALKERRKTLAAQEQERERALERKRSELRQIESELKPFDERMKKALVEAKQREAVLRDREEKLKAMRKEFAGSREAAEKLAVVGAEMQKELGMLDTRLAEIKKTKGTGIVAGLKKLAGLEKRLGEAENAIKNSLGEVEKLGSRMPGQVAEKLRRNLKALLSFREGMQRDIKAVAEMLSMHSPEQEVQRHTGRRKELMKRAIENSKEAESARSEAEEIAKEIEQVEEALAAERKAGIAAGEQEAAAKLREKHSEVRNSITELNTGLQESALRERELSAEIDETKGKANEFSKKASEEEAKTAVFGKELADAQAELEKHTKAERILQEERQRLSTKAENISEKRAAAEQGIERLQQSMNESQLETTRIETRLGDMEQESEQYAGARPVEGAAIPALEKRIPEIEKEIKELGAVNMRAIEGFEEYRKEVVEVREKAGKLEKERLAVLDMIDRIDVKKLGAFMQCFNEINRHFSRLYREFFEGEGKLGLGDAEDPLQGGLTIEAKYAGGMLKSIDAMSGGEKALTALAFLFAIQSYESAPFYIFDEADAALDMANSMKLARLIKDVSKQLQFISITHNSVVTKEADQLIGVALNKQRSSVVGLRLGGRVEDAEKQLNPGDRSSSAEESARK